MRECKHDSEAGREQQSKNRKAYQEAEVAQHLVGNDVHDSHVKLEHGHGSEVQKEQKGREHTKKPKLPSILLDTMSMTVTLGLSTMHVTRASPMSRLTLMSVPGAVLYRTYRIGTTEKVRCHLVGWNPAP